MLQIEFALKFFVKSFIALLLFLVSAIAQAQPGTIDHTFNPSDQGFGTGVGASNTIRDVKVQEDGKVLIGGSFVTYHGTSRNRIARLHPDGTLDKEFNPGTGANGEVRTIALQENGKIIIGGNFTSYNGTSRNRIARLHPDGTLDTSFDPGAGANALVQQISLLNNGKILINGAFTSYADTEQNYITQLQADGSRDTGFTPGTGANGIIHTATLQADGKIIVGGAFTSYNGTGINRIARLNTDGTLDVTFTPGTGASGIVYAAKVQADGKIVIGGAFTTYNGTSRTRIARLQANGNLDTEFLPGTGASGTVHTVAISSDGKIIAGGEFVTFSGTTRNRIARLNADGTLDTTFDPGAGAGGIVYATAYLNNGQLLIAGAFTAYNEVVKNRIARLQPDGSLDEDFDPGAGANGIVYAAAVTEDGKLLIGGAFTSYNGILVNRIARINKNGSLDNSFLSGTGANGEVRTVALQPDGKLIVGGSFTTFNGTTRTRIVRLHTDRSLDSSFDPGAGANGTVHVILFLPETDKLLIGGAFTSYNGIARNRIARLNSDGSLDMSFDPGTGASNIVYTIAMQPDGKILAGGTFTSYNGTSRARIARLNADGSLDTGFNPGTGASSDVRTLALQADGKIFIGGNFTTYNGISRNRVARLNTDGSLDISFLPGSGAGALVHTSLVQRDSSILIGGDFTTFDGTARSRFARLKANGSLDKEFEPRAGASGAIHTVALQQDGNLFIGGAFTSYDATGRNRIARVQNQANVLSFEHQQDTGLQVLVYPNPSHRDFYIEMNGIKAQEAVTLELYESTGQLVLHKKVNAEDLLSGMKMPVATILPNGIYYLRINIRNSTITKKLVRAD